MTKFGVRLLGMLFIAWGVINVVGLIRGCNPLGTPIQVFLGPINISPWFEACLRIYTGILLIGLKSTGRFWALLILWFGLLSSIILTGYIFYQEGIEDFAIKIVSACRAPIHFVGINALLIVAVVATMYAIPAYFLMQKRTKYLFQKPPALEPTPHPTTSQDSTHAQ